MRIGFFGISLILGIVGGLTYFDYLIPGFTMPEPIDNQAFFTSFAAWILLLIRYFK